MVKMNRERQEATQPVKRCHPPCAGDRRRIGSPEERRHRQEHKPREHDQHGPDGKKPIANPDADASITASGGKITVTLVRTGTSTNRLAKPSITRLD
jgi:hypothetical protein